MKRFGFPKNERLRKHYEFERAIKTGTRYHTKHFVIFVSPNTQGVTRLGVTVSRKVGKAVKRNRVKRLIREFFRLHKYSLPRGCDIVIIARPGAVNLNFWQVAQELGSLLCKR